MSHYRLPGAPDYPPPPDEVSNATMLVKCLAERCHLFGGLGEFELPGSSGRFVATRSESGSLCNPDLLDYDGGFNGTIELTEATLNIRLDMLGKWTTCPSGASLGRGGEIWTFTGHPQNRSPVTRIPSAAPQTPPITVRPAG